MLISTLFTEGNGNIPACISLALTLPEVVRVVATCRPARDGLRWHRARLVWPMGKGCSLPHALAHLVAGQQVREICFRESSTEHAINDEVQDSWLASIATHCTGLRALDLRSCEEVTDAGLQHVASCAQLASLSLYDCKKVTDAGLQYLASCPQLASLNLVCCKKVTDAGVEQLRRELQPDCAVTRDY